MIDVSELPAGRRAIVRIGESVECCYPGISSWGAFAALYLQLAKRHPELAELILEQGLDDNANMQPFIDAVDKLAEECSAS